MSRTCQKPTGTRPIASIKPTTPYDITRLFNEETSVEREIIAHLRAPALGWTYVPREQLAALRPDEREVLLLPVLRDKLKQLNPTILTDGARVDAIITFVTKDGKIEKDDHNTPKTWGQIKDDGTIERYMGRPYTVTDALRDKVVRPIHWQPRKTDW